MHQQEQSPQTGPLDLDTLKKIYPPQQMLTDDVDIIVVTFDGGDCICFNIVTRGPLAKRKFKQGTDVAEMKSYLDHWMMTQYGIDFDNFHGVDG